MEPETHHQPALGDEGQNTTETQATEPSQASEEVYTEDVDGHMNKRLIDDVLLNTSGSYEVNAVDSEPERKRARKMSGDQQIKRHKYDVVQAFFRVYFITEKDAMVLKDLIYNLYCKKITTDCRIARNALYRHMWSYHKDKISAFQSNYREFVKGLKLRNSNHSMYEGYEKDIDLLRAAGAIDLWDFSENELQAPPDVKPIPSSPPQTHNPAATTLSPEKFPGVAGAYIDKDANLLSYIDSLEQTAKNLVNALKELKSKVRKK